MQRLIESLLATQMVSSVANMLTAIADKGAVDEIVGSLDCATDSDSARLKLFCLDQVTSFLVRMVNLPFSQVSRSDMLSIWIIMDQSPVC